MPLRKQDNAQSEQCEAGKGAEDDTENARLRSVGKAERGGLTGSADAEHGEDANHRGGTDAGDAVGTTKVTHEACNHRGGEGNDEQGDVSLRENFLFHNYSILLVCDSNNYMTARTDEPWNLYP